MLSYTECLLEKHMMIFDEAISQIGENYTLLDMHQQPTNSNKLLP